MRKRRINLWKFLQQLHLQLRTNIFASSFSDDSTSNSPQGNGSRHHSVFTLFFCFPEKCDNSKHINLVFFSTVKGRGLVCLKPFSLFPCFFFGTWRVKPDAFAARQRDEQADVYYDTAKGERDVIFFFSSQCSTWRADQQAERAEWKGVKGHSVQQRRISRHGGTDNIHDSWTTCLLPLVTILLSQGFSGVRGICFIHLIVKRIMNFMQVEIRKKKKKGNTWSQCNPGKCSVLLWYEELRKNPTFDIQS